MHRHRPAHWLHCQSALPPDAPAAAPPQRRQVWDLPPIHAPVTEHQLLGIACPNCAAFVYAALPPAVPPGRFGPQVVALVGLLHGRFRLSAREVVAILGTVFGVALGLGSVPACCATVRAAVAPCYEQVAAAVQTQAAVNVDETGWQQAGVRHWLWVAVAATCTRYLVSRHRNRATLQVLRGLVFTGVIGSDRYNAYGGRDPTLRQLCWAHLLRNLQACAERGGAAGAWATEVLGQVRLVFRHGHA
ncbi:MAG: transposase [Chloroflexota bacterium]|nr:transposase [Chloroflexota bacterium]